MNKTDRNSRNNTTLIEGSGDNQLYPDFVIRDFSCSEFSDNISLDSINNQNDEDNYDIKIFKEKYNNKEQKTQFGDLEIQGRNLYSCTLDDLNFVSLDPITITPQNLKQSKVLNLQQTFTFPQNFGRTANSLKETFTQTSKTLVNSIKNDEKIERPSTSNGRKSNFNRTFTVFKKLSHSEISKTSTEDPLDSIQESESNRGHVPFMLPTQKNQNKPELEILKKILPPQQQQQKVQEQREYSNSTCATPIYTRKMNLPRPVSKKKLFKAIQKAEYLISPRPSSKFETSSDTHSYNNGGSKVMITDSATSSSESNYSNDVTVGTVLEKLYDGSWIVSLQGLHELLYITPRTDWNLYERDISSINRKIIDLFRSPRSTVCRLACQVAGELFRFVKCTKRPEFDEIVDILLCKTSDSNRFIQKDANIALDKMVTYIPSFHSVRSLCSRGPSHKNGIVRTATARLIVCICAITGIENILSSNANIHTRKRILTNLGKFLTDKNQDTRKFGERLYKMLRKHKFFDEYFFKDLEVNYKMQLKKIINSIDK